MTSSGRPALSSAAGEGADHDREEGRIMRNRLSRILLVVATAAAAASSALGNVPLQCSAAGVMAQQATVLGPTVGCRIYSVSGGDTGFNQNQCYINNSTCCSDLTDPI